MSEVVPGDEDRDGGGAIAPDDDVAQDTDEQTEGGTGSDDGGPGSRNQ